MRHLNAYIVAKELLVNYDIAALRTPTLFFNRADAEAAKVSGDSILIVTVPVPNSIALKRVIQKERAS